MSEKKIIYSNGVIEFVTVCAETIRFLTSSEEYTKKDLVDRALKLLPLVYLKVTLLPETDRVLEEEELEDFVSETEYEYLRESLATRLGESDRYLDVDEEDGGYGEEVRSADVSEDLADVYQDLQNFMMRFQMGNEAVMNDALAELTDHFHTYWGMRLLSALRALHRIRWSEETEWEETEKAEEDEAAPLPMGEKPLLKKDTMRDRILDYQKKPKK